MDGGLRNEFRVAKRAVDRRGHSGRWGRQHPRALGEIGLRRKHVARDGTYKIVNECSLPYTGRGVVQRISTDLCVIYIEPGPQGACI